MVYNVDLELTHPIHFMYPGQFFKIDIFSPSAFNIKVGDETRSIFEELGLNGFYAVTKVNTSINTKTKIMTTKVSGIFIGSDAPYTVRKFNPNNQSISDAPPSPQQIACDEFVQLSEEIGVLEATGGGGQRAIDDYIGGIIQTFQQGLQELAELEQEQSQAAEEVPAANDEEEPPVETPEGPVT